MPQRTIHYADHELDRADERRRDAAWIRERLGAPETRVVVVTRRRFAFVRDGATRPAYLSVAEAAAHRDDADFILLGVRDGIAYFALDAGDAPPAAIGEDAELLGLRDVVTDLGHVDGSVLAYAGALVHWHATHRYCGACGSATAAERAGHMRRCTAEDCGRQHFPRTDPAVITLVTDGERCLLARRAVWAANRRSTVAGFVEPGETLEHAVAREVFEEVGVRVGEVRYRGSQPWPFPQSLMLGFWATATSTDITVDDDEIAEADWYTVDRIRTETASGELVLPPFDSISHRLVADWLELRAGESPPGRC